MANPVATPAASPAFDWPKLLKDSALAAGIAFLLALELVGVQTIDRPQGQDFVTREGDVLAATLLVFFGRLAMLLMERGRPLWGLALSGLFSIYMLAVLLSGSGEELMTLRPFASAIVCWIVTAATIGLSIRGIVLLVRGGRDRSRLARIRATGTAESAPRVKAEQSVLPVITPWLGAAMMLFALAMPWFGFADRRIVDMGTTVLIYVMLGWGLNIVVGLAGLLDLGYVAFYAVGAYSYALLAHYFGFDFWICLPFAGIMAGFTGILLGFPVLRLRGDYLAIVTLGFGEIIRVILINWWWFTGGPDGIRDIPRPQVPFMNLTFERNAPDGMETVHQFLGIEFSPLNRIIFLYYVVLVLALITNFFTLRIRRLPIGRAWEALREDETACRALGINPTNTKLTAFAIGAMFGGFAGSFFATRQGFISPESFTFLESAVILAIVVLGGLGSQVGVVIAAALLIGVPELFRELSDYRMLAFGAGMVLIMIWRPRGLLTHRNPTLRLHKDRRAKSATVSEGTA